MSTVPASAARVTPRHILAKKARGEPVVMVTAYDHPSASAADAAGVDAILVGDSLGMVVLGYDDTLRVTMDDMLHHARAVARARTAALRVGDMPFLSYQADVAEAVRNAGRFLSDGGMDAVKLEGGRERAGTVRAIVEAGIPVMGHLGLTPQSIRALGGYRVQGATAEAARRVLDDALRLEDAGCFAIVLEAIPDRVAALVTSRLAVSTIGIGAGAACDGQVLVWHDLLGWEERIAPRFVRRYAAMAEEARVALGRYGAEVRERRFPAAEHVYPIADAEWARLQADLAARPPAARRPESVAW
ncbi:MAG TPA: 3-methyl-2-oxobutanoate hydroxymethyltransferase [Thermoanaerobaculia bacterium]|nr:3-methyl-2-oxobutanoate hydroxymethyltransferase [Thermoanaerobaculia bacterium]